MKHLLLPLLAALALPTAVNADYSVEENLMTDETEHLIYFSSITKTSNTIGILEDAKIFILCKMKDNVRNKLDVGIKTPTFNSDNTKVAFC